MNTKKRKRMKLPNGFGSVVLRTDGNRRRPWSVKVTINGRQKSIGDTATEIEGLALLAEYHKNPSLFAPTLITFSEVFELMRAERFPKLAKTTQVNYLSAYKHCNRLYNKKFAELKIGDLQAVIRDTRESGALYAMQKKVRQILHHCYTYAVKYEIISPTADISQYIDIDQHKVKYPKMPFNTRQINRVKKLGDKWAMTVLMMIYAGVRTSELLSVAKTDVKLRQRYFIVRESKTAAGRNRAVPISKKLYPILNFGCSSQVNISSLMTTVINSHITNTEHTSILSWPLVDVSIRRTNADTHALLCWIMQGPMIPQSSVSLVTPVKELLNGFILISPSMS